MLAALTLAHSPEVSCLLCDARAGDSTVSSFFNDVRLHSFTPVVIESLIKVVSSSCMKNGRCNPKVILRDLTALFFAQPCPGALVMFRVSGVTLTTELTRQPHIPSVHLLKLARTIFKLRLAYVLNDH